MKIPTEILDLAVVKQTTRVIRVMWDVKGEKPFGQHWLKGMDSNCEEALAMLFNQYGKGTESTATFAKRIANI